MSNQEKPDSTSGAKPKPAESFSEGSAENLPPGLKSALRTAGIDPTNPEIFRAVEISLTMMISGALPIAPPQILNEYKSVDPTLVPKLIDWTEQQSKHRRDIEALRANRSEARLDRGQWIGAAVALGGLALATFVGIFGNPWVASIIAIVAVGGPTAAIYLARNIRNQPTAPQSHSRGQARV